jgi:hypothetical protein
MGTETDSHYFDLTIFAASPTTKIWLSDDGGHLVQAETGTLRTALLAGEYVVEFELGTSTYPISLHEPTELTEADVASGPSCPRPKLRLLDD